MKPRLPAIVCNSGLSLSVQASQYHYCTPRADSGPYSAVEVGFPSRPIADLMPYAEDSSRPTETVYGFVPLAVVERVIAENGGISLNSML